MEHRMNVVITTPHLHLGGGVSNYFNVVGKYFSFKPDFFCLGSRTEKEGFVEKLRHLQSDKQKFSCLMKNCTHKVDLVHINPSFHYASVIRDGFILKEAKRFGKKTVVFFHGWSHGFERIVDKYFLSLFFSVYNLADAFIVLASEFKQQLRGWGFRQPIYLETTPVDDILIDGFSINEKIIVNRAAVDFTLLFFSRIEREKGICETLETVKILVDKFPGIHLVVAGEGSFLGQARQMTVNMGLQNNVKFLGYVKGEEKRKVFINSNVYVLPSYSEGMPTTVLEAMAFGLPVVTRPVGGVKDFFLDGNFGFMSESLDPVVIASNIERILCDKDLAAKISACCHQYATERFMASKVTKRLENIYRIVVTG